MLVDMLEVSNDIILRDLGEACKLGSRGCMKTTMHGAWTASLTGGGPDKVFSPDTVRMYWHSVQEELKYSVRHSRPRRQ